MAYNLYLHKIVFKNEKYYAKWKKPNKKRPHVIWSHLYEMSKKGKSIETERSVVAWGWEWEQGLTVTGTRDLNEVMKIF